MMFPDFNVRRLRNSGSMAMLAAISSSEWSRPLSYVGDDSIIDPFKNQDRSRMSDRRDGGPAASDTFARSP